MRAAINVTPVCSLFFRRTLLLGTAVVMGMVLFVVLLTLVATHQAQRNRPVPSLIHHLADARAPGTAQAQIIPHHLLSPTIAITFAPTHPTQSDVITITLSGIWRNTCVPRYQTHRVSADLISVVANVAPPSAICGQAFTPWTFSVVVGPLPAGVYRVELTGTSDDGFIGLLCTSYFTVLPISVTGVVDSAGGELTQSYAGHRTTLRIPAGALPAPAFFTISSALPPTMTTRLWGIDHFFVLTSTQTTFTTPLTLIVTYSETVRGAIIPGTETLYRWQAGQWVSDEITITANLTNGLTAQISRLSLYGILGVSNRLYLPIVIQ